MFSSQLVPSDSINVQSSLFDVHKITVVHQYDRNEILQKRLFEKYVYWINTSDPLNEWRLTKECESFNIVAKKELFKGLSTYFSLIIPFNF